MFITPRYLSRIILLTLSSFVIGLVLFLSNVLGIFELKAYDLFSRYLNPEKSSENIVLIQIDQSSIEALSNESINWPWPRQIYAPIIEYLSEAEAIFIDILYTEPSSYGEEDDTVLAEAFQKTSNVYLPVFLSRQEKAMTVEDEAFIKNIAIQKEISTSLSFNSAITPVDAFKTVVQGAGNVMITPDEDGVYRKVPLVFQLKQYIVPHFVLNYLIQKGTVKILQNTFYVQDTAIPLLDEKLLLRYYKKSDPFKVFSATEVLKAYLDSQASAIPSIEKDFFRGKFVFIGMTAPGLYDLKPTPISSVFPGVLIHATTLDNILNKGFITPVSDIFVVAFMLLICLSISDAVLRGHSLYKNLSLFLIFLAITLAIPAVLFKNALYLNIIHPAVSTIISFLVSVAYSYATEGRKRKEIKNAFQHYVAPTVVDQILEQVDKLKLGGEKKVLTALFSDIRGFTSISEGMDPERLVSFLNEYLTAMTRIVLSYQGTVDKYMGDAIMAFYGAPLDQPDHAIRACKTAVDMMTRLRVLQRDWEARKLPKIDIGIGLNSGEMTVGNMGSEERFDYTIMGDHVNLASRLEGINKEYGTNIVISQYTYALIKEDSFIVRELDSVRVKGKKEPVIIYELMGYGIPDQQTQDLLKTFGEGLKAYKNRQWDQAIAFFQQALKIRPEDKPSELYVERCQAYQLSPPSEEWDGVFVMKTK